MSDTSTEFKIGEIKAEITGLFTILNGIQHTVLFERQREIIRALLDELAINSKSLPNISSDEQDGYLTGLDDFINRWKDAGN